MTPYRFAVFHQNLIIFTDGSHENDARHVFEMVQPFTAFRSLTTHIDYSVIFVKPYNLKLTTQKDTRKHTPIPTHLNILFLIVNETSVIPVVGALACSRSS